MKIEADEMVVRACVFVICGAMLRRRARMGVDRTGKCGFFFGPGEKEMGRRLRVLVRFGYSIALLITLCMLST